jgi:glycosyltransferase involved in cell wall biosynthesis
MSLNQSESLRAMVLTPCEYALDPRHSYWTELLQDNGYDVVNLEVLDVARHWTSERELFVTENLVSAFAATEISQSKLPANFRWLADKTDTSTGAFLASRTLRYLNAVDQESLRCLDVDLVIANDLIGVVLAQYLWGNRSIDVVYDAQEIFTDSYDLLDGEPLSSSERSSWIELETYLCQHSKQVVTVSPGIADLYRRRHDVDAKVIPNYVPKARQIDSVEDSGPIKFVFLGRAEPHRGLEQLVQEWDYSADVVTLDLIIPDGSYKSRLVALDDSCKRQLSGPKFRESVKPAAIIETLSRYDVGVLPYNYPYPYSEASPNKLGEYIAAGLAILSSDQGFVSQVVTSNSLGEIFSWQNSESFESAIESLSHRTYLQTCTEAVICARREELNFDVGFRLLLEDVKDLTTVATPHTMWLDNLNPYKVEMGRLIASLFRLCRRYLQRIAIRHLRQLGPLINIIGRTKIGRNLAK